MEKISILIADDHKLIRDSWCYLLSSDQRFEVVAECGYADEAVEIAKQIQPHVVLMDINMTPFNGFEATEKILSVSPVSKVIGVSMHMDSAYAKRMIRSGASGYLTKNSSKEEMFNAIDEVLKGNKYLCNEIRTDISHQYLEKAEDAAGSNSLTRREIQICKYVCTGLASREIASRLNISVKTVEVHRYKILKKLKLKNSVMLINFFNTQAEYL
ncbi:MAG: response regulator transcription factor [Bacteroidota bacterium]